MKLSILITLLLSSIVSAQQVVVLHGGKAYLVELNSANEIPLATTGGKVPDANPPVTPLPTGLSGQIAGWTREVSTKPETVKALVLTLQAIRKQVESGKTKPLDVWGGKKLFGSYVGLVVNAAGEADAWKPWLSKHTAEVIRQTQDVNNGLNSKEEVAKLLADTEAGLQGYLDSSGLLQRIDLKKVFRLISFLMSIKDGGLDLEVILDILSQLAG